MRSLGSGSGSGHPVGDPSAFLTSSFLPFGRSGRVTHAAQITIKSPNNDDTHTHRQTHNEVKNGIFAI